MAEPFWMLADVRMVGRRLEGDVQSQLNPQTLRRIAQRAEILHRAELRMDGGVAPLGGADAPGAPDVLGRGVGGVVSSLAEGRADGVNRRQVEHVESH